MLVEVFPYDSRLPALPELMVGPPPELEALLLALFGSDSWQADAWDVEPVRYRTHRRATLRVGTRVRDAATGETRERYIYTKVYRETGVGEQTYRVLQQLSEKASMGETGFNTGKPIAYLSGLRTLVQEEAIGTPIRDVLLQGDDAISAVRRVAKALAYLHLSHVVTPRTGLLRNELIRLERVGKRLRAARPHLAPEIEESPDHRLRDREARPVVFQTQARARSG